MNPRFRRCLLKFVGGDLPDARSRYEVSCFDGEGQRRIEFCGTAVATLQELPWESRIFHRPCWNLHLAVSPEDTGALQEAICPSLKNLPPRSMVWTRVASQHGRAMRSLRAAKFKPLLEMVNLERSLSSNRISHDAISHSIRKAVLKDAARVSALARRIFASDRFHCDAKIPKRWADEAHAEWGRNAVLGKVADRTLVSLKNRAISGFHALKWIDTPQGRVGLTVLIGVGRAFAGQGIGRSLLCAGLEECRRRGSRRMWVRTEASNQPAYHLYRLLGFQETGRFWYLRYAPRFS